MSTNAKHPLKEFIASRFEEAAANFLVNPGADQWTKLMKLMWAYQGVFQMKNDKCESTLDLYIGQLAEYHKGDNDFSNEVPTL